MKTLLAPILTILFCCTFPSVVFGNEFKTEVISSGILTITVPDNHVIHINSFTQEGGSSPELISASLNGASAVNVLAASRIDIDSPDPVNHIAITGSATLTVNAVASATLFLT